MIVLLGHGSLPAALKESAQMIIGSHTDLYTVSLSQDDGQEDLERKLSELDECLPADGRITVLTDIMGGSPCTVALEKYAENARADIVAGMNLPMVLLAVLEEKRGSELVKEGRASVVDAKSFVSGEADLRVVAEDALPNDSGNPHVLVGVRVDARGLHGQVAATWIPHTNATRVILVDDGVVKNEIQKTALRIACPEHVKLSILSVDRASRRLSDPGSYPGERILVVLMNVGTIADLMSKGFVFKTINMGNVPNRPGTVAYAKTVYLTDEERVVVREAMEAGTRFTVQQVPSDSEVTFSLGDGEET